MQTANYEPFVVFVRLRLPGNYLLPTDAAAGWKSIDFLSLVNGVLSGLEERDSPKGYRFRGLELLSLPMSEVTNGYAAADDADDEQCRLLPAFVSPGFLGNCGMVLGASNFCVKSSAWMKSIVGGGFNGCNSVYFRELSSSLHPLYYTVLFKVASIPKLSVVTDDDAPVKVKLDRYQWWPTRRCRDVGCCCCRINTSRSASVGDPWP